MKFFPFLIALLACTPLFAVHGGSIKGLVVDAETNTELAGATLRLNGSEGSTVTNDIGMFSFTDLPGGEYTISVNFIGYQSATQTVRVVDHETVNIKFTLATSTLQLENVDVAVQKSRPLSTLSALDIQLRPINSTQDVLRFVPGLVIAQHAGGGKAEQIFLRGFDIDHGTDIALFADGIPVNMVSHAHGQGYADLHFLIPELVDRVDFQKGPYYASVGNLCTAGYVKFETPAALRQNMLKVEAGEFNTYRTVAAVDLLGARAAARGSSAYVAGETLFSEGYFDNPQDFKRFNLFAKFRQSYDDGKVLTISGSRFTSSWLASGQIPERAVNDGSIGRFGAIDPTEGGRTSRYNLNIEHSNAISDKTLIKNQFFLSKYDFELYSNFTFFLNDPLNGDQIRQKENRLITGYNGAIIHNTNWGGRKLRLEAGPQLRFDDVDDNELSRSKNRITTLERLSLGDVQELNFALYGDASIELTPKFILNAGARFDVFQFSYHNKLDTLQAFRQKAKSIASPKLNLTYAVSSRLSVFAQAGSGFHSNDTRVIVGAARENILPRALGFEAGVLIKPIPQLLLSATAWQLNLEQEFVYVGDEGVVEPGGKTRRQGIDLSARWQLLPWLFLDADYNYTHPRATDEPEGAQYIPLAPTQTSVGGLSVQTKKGFSGSLRYRYVGDRAANEDYSLTAEGYFLLDAVAAYAPVLKNGKQPCEFALSAQNLTDVYWKEAQFETETRLRNEPASVTEIHYTPGTPFYLKGSFTYRF